MPGRPGVALIARESPRPRGPLLHCEGAPYDGTMLGALLMPGPRAAVIGPPIDISPYYGRENEARSPRRSWRWSSSAPSPVLAGRPDF